MSNISIECFPDNLCSLGFLRESLQSMGLVIDRYIDHFLPSFPSADCPFAYNERATLSQFVGGIWLSNPNNFALEEYSGEKTCNQRKYRGRGDIWFCASGQCCYGEAKQKWSTVPGRNRVHIERSIRSLIEECDAAVNNSIEERLAGSVRMPLGIHFLVISAHQKTLTKFQSKYSTFRDMMRGVLQELSASGMDVIWSSYFRPELLVADRCYQDKQGRTLTHPVLETLICTPKTIDHNANETNKMEPTRGNRKAHEEYG